jgi:hypothetical protein
LPSKGYNLKKDMRTFIASVLATAALSLETVQNGWSTLTITEDGVQKTKYWTVGASSGTTMNVPYNQRGYITNTPSLDVNGFYKPNLLGGSVEYDVNLSSSTCGCVAAFYLVGSPGKNSSGNYWNTDGYYYCDAN